jgi:hypothetical protein
MEASFYPPRHIFNNNTYDDNLKIQHEALKRVVNIYDNEPIHRTNEPEETPIIEKMPAPIKIKRRTKKDIKELMA